MHVQSGPAIIGLIDNNLTLGGMAVPVHAQFFNYHIQLITNHNHQA
jgi:hypothetical protein